MKLSEIKNRIVAEEEATNIVSVPYKEVLNRSYDDLKRTNPEDVMTFGYDWLDNKLAGIFPGQLILIGGETGSGKTTFSTSIVCKQKCPTAIFALEDTLEEYGKKIMYFEMGKIRKLEGKLNYPYIAYLRGELNEKSEFEKDYAKAYEGLRRKYPLFQEIKNKIVWELIRERIKILAFQQGVKLILIDHLHYFDLLAHNVNKNDYIEQIIVDMKSVAKETGIGIILVAHYRKLNGNKPTLDSFKDSMAIAQNANTVINIWRNREQGITNDERFKTQMIISKTRVMGGEGIINVKFNPSRGEYDLDEEEKWRNGVPTRDENYNLNKLNV